MKRKAFHTAAHTQKEKEKIVNCSFRANPTNEYTESYIAILLIAFIICSLWGKAALFHYYLFCKAPLWEWFVIDFERWKNT